MSELKKRGWAEVSDWSSLVAEWSSRVPQDLESDVALNRKDLATARPDPPGFPLPALFGSVGELAARVVVLHGAAACLPAIAVYKPYLPEAIRQLNDLLTETARWSNLTISLLAFMNVLRCCGEVLPLEIEKDNLEAHWLEGAAQHRKFLAPDKRLSAAFACLPTRQTHLIPHFIGGRALRKTMEPGRIFGADTTEFVRYIAVALTVGAPADAILPAWHDFLADFPRKTARNSIRWHDLLWCAYTIMVTVEQRQAATVADTLHAAAMVLSERE